MATPVLHHVPTSIAYASNQVQSPVEFPSDVFDSPSSDNYDRSSSPSSMVPAPASKTISGAPLPNQTHKSTPLASIRSSLARAELLLSRHKYAEALSVYDSLLRLDPQNESAFIGKGMCFQAQRQPRLAFDCFAEALGLNPKNSKALTQFGVLCKEEGHLNDATEVSICDRIHSSDQSLATLSWTNFMCNVGVKSMLKYCSNICHECHDIHVVNVRNLYHTDYVLGNESMIVFGHEWCHMQVAILIITKSESMPRLPATSSPSI